MKQAKTTSVNMTFSALYSYVLNTNYRSFGGVMGLLLSLGACVMLAISWNVMDVRTRIVYILVALLFTVVNPLMLAFKTWRQLKLSPSYRRPLEYTFHDDGITVCQADQSMDLEWKSICRLMMTKHMVAIYTNRVNAFVIPLEQLGDEKGKILASIVNFTAQYHPRVSKSLERYQSGKGI